MAAEMYGCDESRCVSQGGSDQHHNSFTCYGDNDGTFYPMMCADGFLPVSSGEASLVLEENAAAGGVIFLSHFTCCPPPIRTSSSSEKQPQHNYERHCSDPITTKSVDENSLCANQRFRKYPRPMEPNLVLADGFLEEIHSFLCCDSNVTTTMENNFLDDSECVPYRNRYYESIEVKNDVGMLRAISCDFPDDDEGGFMVPRSIEASYLSSSNRYQCCRNGTALLPFVQDSAYQTTLYPIVALWSLSAVVSVIVGVGLLIPLLIQLKDGIFQSTGGQRRSSQRRKSSNFFATQQQQPSESFTLGSSSKQSSSKRDGTSREFSRSKSSDMSRRRSSRRVVAIYSTYNLYLVHLAMLDFVYAIFQIWMLGRILDQQFNPRFFYPAVIFPSDIPYNSLPQDGPILFSYAAANMWINAIISYQLLILLQTTRKARRINQPSLARVNAQAGAVYFTSVVFACSGYFLLEEIHRAGDNGDFDLVKTLYYVFLGSVGVMFVLPLLYVFYVTVLIWWLGYIPSVTGKDPRDRAMRQLAFFYLRIVAVFIGIWIPSMVLAEYVVMLTLCFTAVQPILTTCMILTKSDARKYIFDFVTLSYLRRSARCSQRIRSPKGTTHNSQQQQVDPRHVWSAAEEAGSSKAEDPSSTASRPSSLVVVSVASVASDSSDANADSDDDVDNTNANEGFDRDDVVGDIVGNGEDESSKVEA